MFYWCIQVSACCRGRQVWHKLIHVRLCMTNDIVASFPRYTICSLRASLCARLTYIYRFAFTTEMVRFLFMYLWWISGTMFTLIILRCDVTKMGKYDMCVCGCVKLQELYMSSSEYFLFFSWIWWIDSNLIQVISVGIAIPNTWNAILDSASTPLPIKKKKKKKFWLYRLSLGL
jgi:hypothetical protein